jgi:hypothetical protein
MQIGSGASGDPATASTAWAAMRPVRAAIWHLLTTLEGAGQAGNVETLGPLFADQFMNLGPGQSSVVPRGAFLRALPARRAMFESIQATGLALSAAWETELDRDHVWVEARWRLHIEDAAGDRGLELASALLLQRRDDGWQVVVYLNHHDIAAVVDQLRARR